MSNDQQYPYDQGQGQGQGQARDQGQARGPYGAQGAGRGPQGSQGSQGSQGWAEPQQPPRGQQEVPAAQTWEGQTWDTQYQPQIRPQTAGPAYPQSPQAPQPQRAAAAADTAYLPQQPAAPGPTQPPAQPPFQAQAHAQAHAQAQAQAPMQSPVPGASGAPGTDGYSAPTTLGAARMTDAQRARAEGRSPIIPPGIQPAGLTALLGLLMAGGAALGPYGLLVPLVLLQAVTAAGWFRLNGMWPARQGIALAFLGGLVADVALLAAGRENGAAAIIGTLGVWVLLVVVLQLRSPATGDERMAGLMAAVVSAALAILAAGHLAAVPSAVVVGAIAVAVATVVRALPLPGLVSRVAAALAAAGAGFVAGGLTGGELTGGTGALLGLVAGVCALIGLRVASYDYPSRFVHMTAGVALPLTAAAPAVYLLGRALI